MNLFYRLVRYMGSFIYDNSDELFQLKKLNIRVGRMAKTMERQTELIEQQNALLSRLVDLVHGHVRPRKPRFSLKLVGESDMDILKFGVVAETIDPDTEQRELKVSVDGTVVFEHTYGKAEAMEFEVAQDAVAHVELVDIDDGGNRSAAGVLDFTATDTNVPAGPGSLGLTFISEREAPPVEPTEPPA